MAGERSTLVDAPEDQDANSSLHKGRVNDKSLCDRRDIDHKNMCNDSTSFKDDRTKLTVNSFDCKKSNVDVLAEVHETVGEPFPCLNQSGNKGVPEMSLS